MSTTVRDAADFADDSSVEHRCRLAVFYEDTPARERAVTLTHRLIESFWEDLDFGVSWWRFHYLADPVIAESAALSALEADVLVFSAPAQHGPGPEVRSWFDLWVPHRSEESGVLVPLLDPATADALSTSPWMVELEEVATRARLDCLLPAQLQDSPLFAVSARRVDQKSRHVGGVIDEILQRRSPSSPPPPHWGLNE